MSKTLDRVVALLAKAESTDSEAERDACMAKAQQLATLAAIDLETARQRQKSAGRRETPVTRAIMLFPGSRRSQGRPEFIRLFLHIADVNDVRCDVYRDSSGVVAYGFPSSIDVVEALYGSLAVQMRAAADAYLKSGQHRTQTGVYVDQAGRRTRKTLDGRTARRQFYAAFVPAVGARLQAARAAVTTDPVPASSGDDVDNRERPSGELVLLERKQEVDDHYRRSSAARGAWRPRASSATADGQRTAQAGRRAGERARLGAPRALGGIGGELTG